MKASESTIDKVAGMSVALDWAIAAFKNKGADPSNGGFWWDGLDFKTNYSNHPKVRDGFRFGDPSHNIFNVQEKKREVIVRWKIRKKNTGQIVDGAERGRYDAVWASTAAHGSTIFWKHPEDYIQATGGKDYNENKKSSDHIDNFFFIIYCRWRCMGCKWQPDHSSSVAVKDRSS